MAFLRAGVQKKVFSISNFFRLLKISWVKSILGKNPIFPHPSYILKSEASGLQHEIKNWVDDIKIEG